MDIMRQYFATARDEPIVDSRLRNDVYKWIMDFFARARKVHNTEVVFGLTNRGTELRLAEVIPEAFLREQLDHVRGVQLTPAYASFLQGMTVEEHDAYKFMFPDPSYAAFLEAQTLSDYELRTVPGEGQFDLRFKGTWFGAKNAASLWEVPAMKIICESYVYWYLKGLLDRNEVTRSEIRAWFAAAERRVVENAKLFRDAPGNPTCAQFGLRREVSTDYTRHAQDIIDEVMGERCVGVSDTHLAYERGSSNPKGTVAHELAMVWQTLGPDTDDWIRESQFEVALWWARTFPRPLRILLPDCLGTEQFYAHAPREIAEQYDGTRIDSMETGLHDPLYLAWLARHDIDPKTVIVIPSDGQTAEKFLPEYERFGHRYRAFSAGIGGGWTNNVKGIAGPGFRTPNIVIKAWYANGRPCTKIGDAPDGGKVTGPDKVHNVRVMRAVSPEGWAEHNRERLRLRRLSCL